MDDNDVSITALGGSPFSASITSMGFDATGSGSLPGAGDLPISSGVVSGGSSVVILGDHSGAAAGPAGTAAPHGSSLANDPGTAEHFWAGIVATNLSNAAKNMADEVAMMSSTPTRYVEPWWAGHSGSAVSDKGNSAAGLWRRLDSAVSEIDQGIQALWPDYTHDNAMTYDMTHDQPEYHLWDYDPLHIIDDQGNKKLSLPPPTHVTMKTGEQLLNEAMIGTISDNGIGYNGQAGTSIMSP
jgi:hypothetical protein